ncbi:MAG: hypothetical protein QOG91_335, partial [Candidatus Parcubacteria bacterium]|nr:hypothetical protein [Candidatus Parcubacteria bacterium]
MVVKKFLMHMHPHVDDILTRLIILIYGADVFIGAGKVKPVFKWNFTKEDIREIDQENDKAGILPCACGKNTRFIEYQSTLFNKIRLRGQCSATRAALFLGATHEPAVKGLLREINYYDAHKGQERLQLGAIAKLGHNNFPEDNIRVLNRIGEGLNAIMADQEFHLSKRVPGEKTLQQFFDQRKNKYADDPRIEAFMAKEVAVSMQTGKVDGLGRESLTRAGYVLSRIYRALDREDPKRRKQNLEVARDWAVFVLDSMFGDQARFWLMADHIRDTKPKPLIIKIVPMLRREKRKKGEKQKWRQVNSLKCFTFETDSHHAHSAGFHDNGDIVWARRSTGHCQVFTSDRVQGLHLRRVAEMVRWSEMTEAQRATIIWKRLCTEGNYPGEEKWYYIFETLLNASDTHRPDPTRISDDDFFDILEHGFHPEAVRLWWMKHGIDYKKTVRAGKIVKITRRPAPVPPVKTKSKSEAAPKPKTKPETKPETKTKPDKKVATSLNGQPRRIVQRGRL